MAKLAGCEVSADMYNEAVNLKRRGARIFLAKGDSVEGEGGCKNCVGTGKIGLQTVVGGPHKTPQSSADARSITWIGNAWFNVKTELWFCPICSGSGVASVKHPAAQQARVSEAFSALVGGKVTT